MNQTMGENAPGSETNAPKEPRKLSKCGCHSCQFHFLVSTWPKWPVHYLNKLIVNKSNKSK